MVDVDPVSPSVSHAEAEAAEAPSSPLSSPQTGRWASISIASSTSICEDNGDDDGGLAVVYSSSSRIVKTSSKFSCCAGANRGGIDGLVFCLWDTELRCRIRLVLHVFCLEIKRLHAAQ